MNSQAKVILSAEDRTAAAFASAMRNVDKLGFSFDTLKAGAMGALSALAVPVSVAGIASVFSESRKAIDGLQDLADASGASVGAISALDNIARSTGGNLDTVSSILVKFNGVLADADPSKGVGATLTAIGLSLDELKRMDPAEALRVTAVAVEQLGNEADKARVYQDLFGKSVRDAAPFLKDLAEAKRLDATLTDEQVEAVDRFNKEMAKLQASAGNVARSLTVTVAGALNTVIDRFREGQKEGKGFWQIALEGYKKDVAALYGMDKPAGSRSVSGYIGDETDPRAELRRMERAQDTRPSLPTPPRPTTDPKTNKPRAGGMSDAEKREADYQQSLRDYNNAQDAYVQKRHAEQIREREKLEKEHADWLNDMEDAAGEYVYQRNVKRFEDEAKAREQAAEKASRAELQQAEKLGDAFASTFDRMFTEGMKFGDLLKKLAFDAINIQLLTPATQKLGGMLGSAVSSLFSFDGGGYTGSGSRSGGLDGKGGFMAMLHPNETVLDHTKGQGMGGGGTTIVQSFTIDARGADAGVEQRIRAAMEQSKRETLAAVRANVNRGGSWASTMGRA